MSIRLFTIGDSVSQGFIHGGAARTETAFSTLLAEALGISGYQYLDWGANKLKVDLEIVLRYLQEKRGNDIAGLEWVAAAFDINHVLDGWEEYFERGQGKLGLPISSPQPFFHNVAVEGMTVADAWSVTPELCTQMVNSNPDSKKDDLVGVASESFYRNAYRVLNPHALPAHNTKSPLDWLSYHCANGGVENLVLWLGANNALGTVIGLNVKQTPGDGTTAINANRKTRETWNLWHPRDFEAEFSLLMAKVDEAVGENAAQDCHVFVGTVPLVTIAPLTKGIGEARIVPDPSGRTDRQFRYYQDYTYFFLSEPLATKMNAKLSFPDALFIDKTIIEFNNIIIRLTEAANLKADNPRVKYHIVPISDCLTDMAWKRNSGSPTYKYPPEFQWLYPPVDSKYYDVDPKGKQVAGGLFGLDGVHPSVIGQGLIAHEFLKAMQAAGRAAGGIAIPWPQVFSSDSLRTNPIRVMHELYENDGLIRFLLFVSSLFSKNA